MKKILVLAIVSITGCASTMTSQRIGNMQMDCVPGLLSPSGCLITSYVGKDVSNQYPISGTGFLGIAVPAAAQVGGAALIGSGLGRSGSNTTNQNINKSSGGTNTGGQGGLGGAATGGQGGGSATAISSGGASSLNSNAQGGSSTSNANAQGGEGGESSAVSVSNSDADAVSRSSSTSEAEAELDQHLNVDGGCHGNCD